LNSTVSSNTAPALDELEVSVFGPGFGECVVVHLGQGDWMVVDSCLNNTRAQPIALEYLNSLGVDIATQVRLVVLTHWHDDHIRGSAKVFSEALSARFACSAALRNREFLSILAASEQVRPVARDGSISEFESILEELHRRNKRGVRRSQGGPDFWAQDGLPLFQSIGTGSATVTALSPSSQTMTDAAARFGKLIPKVSSQIKRFPRSTPNDQSVALLVQSPACSILLGADLETVGDPQRGWQAIVDSPSRPQVMCDAIKVAHHGSENGDHDDIWSTLMHPDPPAFVTPYASGKKPLPSEDDIQRLKSRTRQLYCTTWPPTRRPPRRNSSVQRTLREMALSHRSVSKRVGQIRLRASMTQQGIPTIQTFEGARQL
jgi:hypothetical protein